MSFTAALHTYFTVSAIEAVSVEGLGGVTYTDSLQGGSKVVQEGPVVFDQEVDRIYLAAPDAAMKVCIAGVVVFVWGDGCSGKGGRGSKGGRRVDFDVHRHTERMVHSCRTHVCVFCLLPVAPS